MKNLGRLSPLATRVAFYRGMGMERIQRIREPDRMTGPSGVEEAKSPERDAGAKRGDQGEHNLDRKFPVLHPDFLAKAFDLNGHKMRS
jgi:hypothetical protein